MKTGIHMSLTLSDKVKKKINCVDINKRKKQGFIKKILKMMGVR